MDPNGHAAIVTGGASGLGARDRGCARARPAPRLRVSTSTWTAPREVAARIGGHAVRCDVADAESAAAAVAEARGAHGAARILVNCAGIGPAKRIVGRDGPMPLADFERVIAINLIGTFNMLRLAAADMTPLEPLADGERGIIVSTASVAAFEGQVGQAAYAASKGGVAALTMPAARELAQFGIRVHGDRAGHLRHPDAARPAGGRAAEPRRLGAVPASCSAGPSSSPTSCSTACATPTSTARSSASTARCAWRRADFRKIQCSATPARSAIEWGDCDPAGIVFYPRYFEMFETCIPPCSSAPPA